MVISKFNSFIENPCGEIALSEIGLKTKLWQILTRLSQDDTNRMLHFLFLETNKDNPNLILSEDAVQAISLLLIDTCITVPTK